MPYKIQDEIARKFVDARRNGRILPAFPGVFPRKRSAAYAVQEAVLAITPRRLAGWKVASVAPQFRDDYPEGRIAGPVFADGVQEAASGSAMTIAVYDGGFGAVEAEFIVRLVMNLPAGEITAPDIEASATLHAGCEIASSPLPTINDLGPAAVVADHGNNAGAIIGPEITSGFQWSDLRTRSFVDGKLVGEGSAARVLGGPFAAAAFLANHLHSRGRELSAGDIVLTGMTTGVHPVVPGSQARIEFEGIASFDMRVTAIVPQKEILHRAS